ncbi:MAG: DNA/RNA nuclease SfsA [Firmicutes bacterium]|nr:DNA/RNA nuclease SfsA [Bacillota bacterium]
MKYRNITEGIFIDRPNRFVAKVMIQGKEEKVHVKNTGRCKELLTPDAKVYLEDYIERMGTRKLRYSLIGVEKEGLLINMDSQAPNQVVREALLGRTLLLPDMDKLEAVKAETMYGKSRLDFYVEDEKGQKGFVEVKGVTLEENGVVRFPDAPTERGLRHMEELIKARREGYLTYILFVVQMKGVLYFEPNDKTHLAFGEMLRKADKSGVFVLAYDCRVTRDSMALDEPVDIKLHKFVE